MSRRITGARPVSPAARVFSNLQADDALLPGEASVLRKSSALFLALLVLGAVPLFWAANAAGVIGDLPAAVAHGGNSGPGSGDDDNSGPGGGDDDDDDDVAKAQATDDTSGANSTRGTTNDNDTRTVTGTDTGTNTGTGS
jgi:hypothetical protein